MDQFDRIALHPDTMGGKACIRGTRVTVGMIVGQIGAGRTFEALLEDYPYLKRDDMLQALRYAAWRAEEREIKLASLMRLLIDMNLSPRWAEFFLHAGFEAVHWSMIGPADAADPALMTFALAHDYIIVTHDLDFGAILAATQGNGPSVVQIRADDLAPAAIGRQIVAALRQACDALTAGALVTVDPARSRITLLPIRG